MNLPMERSVIVFIATSLDGYIAKPNDDLSFLSIVEREGEDYGYAALLNRVDTVIIGRKTYEWVLAQAGMFPHADKETYVITRQDRPASGRITFYNGPLDQLITRLKAAPGKAIFCDGGAEVVNEMLRQDLIDELVVSVVPVMVGEGIRLFQDGRPGQHWRLDSARAFESGLVQVRYLRERSS